MSDLVYEKLKKGDIVHYVRALKSADCYDLLELKIVNVYSDYCSATESKSKQTFIFNRSRSE